VHGSPVEREPEAAPRVQSTALRQRRGRAYLSLPPYPPGNQPG
jgi:hypothetical protein